MNLAELSTLQLELAVVGLGLLVMLADAFFPKLDKRRLGQFTALALGLMLAASFMVQPAAASFNGMYRLDTLALFFKRLFLATGVFVALMSADFSTPTRQHAGGYYAVMLLALTGMMLCASANDFVMLFVSLELITVSFYVLVSFARTKTASLEAGTKYLIIGALSSGFMVYGIAFIFGMTGTTNFDALATIFSQSKMPSGLLLMGMILVIVGLGFKVASVPFQIWVPDVYQGAPTPVTSFLAVGSKAAGFVLLVRVLFGAWNPVYSFGSGKLPMVLAALAGVTLLYGNLAAIPQRDIKRLLGYSSIGHAGYMLMGLAAANTIGVEGVLFYLGAYLFTTLAAFIVIVAFYNVSGSDNIPSYSGLARRSPLLATAMLLSMLSLAGIPPLAGFFGKFMLFSAVVQAGRSNPQLYWLAFIGAVTVVISLYFYLGVVRAIFIHAPDDDAPIKVSLPMRAALYVSMAGILFLGIYQEPLLRAAQTAVSILYLR